MQRLLMLALGFLMLASANPVSAGPEPTPKVIQFEADTLSAYRKSLKLNKPLVIVFVCPLTDLRCVHCKRMRGEIFGEKFQVLADRAVFVLAEIEIRNGRKSKDEAAQIIFTKLQMKATPTISVLAPDSKRIHELVRLNGYFPAEKLLVHIERGLKKLPVQKGTSRR